MSNSIMQEPDEPTKEYYEGLSLQGLDQITERYENALRRGEWGGKHLRSSGEIGQHADALTFAEIERRLELAKLDWTERMQDDYEEST